MQDPPPRDSDVERLPDAAAARLIERSSELDVAHAGSSAVADLRAAAAEAGISARGQTRRADALTLVETTLSEDRTR